MKNFTFKINENSYGVKIVSHEDNVIEIEVNGTSYSVKLKEEVKTLKTPTLVRKPNIKSIEPINVKSKSSVTQITAPIPGVIMDVKVKVGDIIKVGDQILVLEAMKMENSISSEKSGIVKVVNVVVGQQVLQGDLMIEIE